MSYDGVARPDLPPSRTAAPTVSVVVPARNEARNVLHVLRLVDPDVHQVVLVDGHSTDGTVEAAQRVRHDIEIVRQQGRGKGDALIAGFAAATGDIIVMLDADGSTCPTEIPRFVDALVAGADFAKGSRFLPGGGSTDITRLRALGNAVLVSTVNRLYGTRYTDLCYGYNAFWRSCLPAIDLDCDGFEVETLINIRIARAGLVVTEVASIELERIHGVSNLHAGRDGLRVLRTILGEFPPRPPARPLRRLLPRLADAARPSPMVASSAETVRPSPSESTA
jgi:glycosyltransferase involved in cell wall biosynthesis